MPTIAATYSSETVDTPPTTLILHLVEVKEYLFRVCSLLARLGIYNKNLLNDSWTQDRLELLAKIDFAIRNQTDIRNPFYIYGKLVGLDATCLKNSND